MTDSKSARELPRCPGYIAHPQSVWFHFHWRPLYEQACKQIEELQHANRERQVTNASFEAGEMALELANVRKERDAFKRYFDDEEQFQTFGHLIRENAQLSENLRISNLAALEADRLRAALEEMARWCTRETPDELCTCIPHRALKAAPIKE